MAKSAKDALDVALPAMTEFAKANKCDAYVVAVFDASSTLVDSRRVEGSPDIILKILRAKALEVKASGKKNAGATPMPVFMCCHLPCILCCGMPTTTMGAAPFTYVDDAGAVVDGVLAVSGGTSAQDGELLDAMLAQNGV